MKRENARGAEKESQMWEEKRKEEKYQEKTRKGQATAQRVTENTRKRE